jgi:diguanylate cyclase (GGDEF)-like protein/PAS domain S-box-containing protein
VNELDLDPDLDHTQRRLAAANQRMNIILEATSDAIVGLNAQGVITFANRATSTLTGSSEDKLVGADLHGVLHPGCHEVACTLGTALRSGGSATIETVIAGPDGQLGSGEGERRDGQRRARSRPGGQRRGDGSRIVECDIRPATPVTRRTVAVVTFRDVTQRRAQEQALTDARSRFSVAFDAAPIGMAITDVRGRFLRVNRAFCELTGYERAQLEGPEAVRLAHPEDRVAEDRARAELVAGRIPEFRLDQRLLRADGDTRWVKVSASLVDGTESPEIIMQVEDITKARQIEQLLAHRALHDSLTGLANRTLLVDRIEHALSARDRRGLRDEVAVLFIDLDRFKHTNDALGHEVADRVLVSMANRIRAVLRPGDTAARIGGDEFVVLCEELGHAEVEEMSTRLHEVIRAPLIVGTSEVRVSASIGVVLATDGDTASDLLRDADTAMYAAKERGRSRTEVFDTDLRAVTTARLHLETSLGHALSNDEIEVVYQPTVDLRTQQIEGVEALVRWRHNEHGILTPSAFLDVAEDTGLIVPIGLYVLNDACRQAASWQREQHRDLVVAVNLSARQLNRHGLPEAVARLLDGHGLPPSVLRLEITESILVDAGSHTASNLKELQELGVSIGIDDFGTGYASLTYLKRFPVDFIKIDKSFVEGLGVDREDTAIVQAIIALGASLGLSSIAEGVETAEQAHLLRDLGCHFAQGYLFGRPDSAAQLTERLHTPHTARTAHTSPTPAEGGRR